MGDGSRGGRKSDELAPDVAHVLSELSQDPGAPSLDALTVFVNAVHVRLFGVARDPERPLAERLGAITQLGREGASAGPEDPKGVRPHLRKLLVALRSRETALPGADERIVAEIDRALEQCR